MLVFGASVSVSDCASVCDSASATLTVPHQHGGRGVEGGFHHLVLVLVLALVSVLVLVLVFCVIGVSVSVSVSASASASASFSASVSIISVLRYLC